MTVYRLAEPMCISITTFLDLWKKYFRGKFISYQRHFVPLCSTERKPAFLLCFNCSWCDSDNWLLWGKHKHLLKTMTFWMSGLPCSIREVIYCWMEMRKSIGRLPCEQKDAHWRFFWIETYIINLFSSLS